MSRHGGRRLTSQNLDSLSVSSVPVSYGPTVKYIMSTEVQKMIPDALENPFHQSEILKLLYQSLMIKWNPTLEQTLQSAHFPMTKN